MFLGILFAPLLFLWPFTPFIHHPLLTLPRLPKSPTGSTFISVSSFQGAERGNECGCDDEPNGDVGYDEGQHHLHRPEHGYDGHHQSVLPGFRPRQGGDDDSASSSLA